MWGSTGEAVEQEEELCNEKKPVREFTYLGGRVSAGGGYEPAATTGTRYGCVKFMLSSRML